MNDAKPSSKMAAVKWMLGWEEAQGFRPRAHLGRPLTVTCFRSLQDERLYARVITDGGELVGADRFYASPDAAESLPLAAD